MPKKKPSRLPKIPSLSRQVIADLSEAEALLDDGKPEEARQILEELDRRRPGLAPVLALLANAYFDLDDVHSYEWACYRLQKIEPNDPDLALALSGAYMGNFHPALAIQALERFLRRWPTHEKAAEARQTIDQIRQGLLREMQDLDLAEDEAFDLALQSEEVRLFLEHSQYAQGKLAAEKLLKRYPDFVPAINNLSQIHAAQGDSGRAIQLCRQALEIEPDNIHALSNLVRLLFLSAQFDEAASIAGRLKASQAPAADYWSKKAEAFSILGDDQTVLELYQQAKDAGALKPPQTDLLFLHLAAVAHWRLGKEKDARRLWQRVLKLDPHYELAQEQLDDLNKPPAERNGPWAFPLINWVTEHTIRDLFRAIQSATQRKQESAIQVAANKFLHEHPELIGLAPHLLQRSDPGGREFVTNLAGMSGHPGLLAALKDFTLGQRGSDEQRTKASQIVSEAGLLPNGPVRMWLRGEWHEILLMNFEISDEVTAPYTNPEAERLTQEGYYALQDGEGQRAQELLERAIALEPDVPSLLNNLAMAYELQGQSQKAHGMLLQIHARFPDYFFGIAGVARLAIKDGDYEKARTLLDSLMQRRQLHYSEYDILCMAQIDLCLAEKNKEAARTWFEMWEQPDPENPKLGAYRLRLRLMNMVSILGWFSQKRKRA